MTRRVQWSAIGVLVAIVIGYLTVADPKPGQQLEVNRAQATELAKQTALLSELQDIQNQLLGLASDHVELSRRLSDLETRVSKVEQVQAEELNRQLDEVWAEITNTHDRMLALQARQIVVVDELQQLGALPESVEVIEVPDLPLRPDYEAPARRVYEPPPAFETPRPTQPPVAAEPTQPPVAAEPTQPPVAAEPTQPPVYEEPSEPEVLFTPAEPSRDCSSSAVFGMTRTLLTRNGCTEATWDGCTPVRVLINDDEVVRLDQNALAGTVRVCAQGIFTILIEDANGTVYERVTIPNSG